MESGPVGLSVGLEEWSGGDEDGTWRLEDVL